MSSVVAFKVPPKTLRRTYKGVAYVVRYIPATKEWEWEITKTTTLRYHERAKTQKDAIKAAEKMIDSIT